MEKKSKSKSGVEERTAKPKMKFSAGMSANLEKARQLCVVMTVMTTLDEELRILRQTVGITSGEKKAIGAMLAKLCKFKGYASSFLLIQEGGAR